MNFHDWINCKYFISEVEKGINREDNKNFKTNLMSEMTSYKFFLIDKKFYENYDKLEKGAVIELKDREGTSIFVFSKVNISVDEIAEWTLLVLSENDKLQFVKRRKSNALCL